MPEIWSRQFSHKGPNKVKSGLIETVGYLSEEIGPRGFLELDRLNRAADYIETRFASLGLKTERQPFGYNGNTYYNVIAEATGLAGGRDGILVIGAHYDTVADTPGADDNASGVAGLIELARLAALAPLPITVKFAAFSMEEPPAFMTIHMGSHAYAESLKEAGANLIAMISLEMIGYYCEEEGCQFYPLPVFRWLYPKQGDFIALVGNLASRTLTRRLGSAIGRLSGLRVETLNTVRLVPGVDFSDHSSFWKFGWPALMITDTAFYRNPHYHGPGDKAGTLDYGRMAALVSALDAALRLMEL